ncbi:MAG: hypothetical protein K1000chlam4_01034 [Chlamydiae bacterium]|nr:hypothetical protein [Chlamydiota bacterium]
MDSKYDLLFYSTEDEKEPFKDWYQSIRDKQTKAIITSRLHRLRMGLFGDCKTLVSSERIKELRINYGPGYRVYFAERGAQVIILLSGGDKKSQKRDIKKAGVYLKDYKVRYEKEK